MAYCINSFFMDVLIFTFDVVQASLMTGLLTGGTALQ
jgi:hypothetical protein